MERSFFAGIEHTPVPWRGHTLHVPIFYPDFAYVAGSWLAPLDRIREILPSTRLHPYRVLPGKGLVSISAYCYRESDLGPYNEVSLGIPVTLDSPAPLFTGIIRKPPTILTSYTHRLPVSTEIARLVGAEFAGYPKFVASIEFTEEQDEVTCRLSDGGRQILTFHGAVLPLRPRRRGYVQPITSRAGYLLRSEFVVSEADVGASKKGQEVALELGDHPMAEEIRSLQLERAVHYLYCPRASGILTPVIESFAASTEIT